MVRAARATFSPKRARYNFRLMPDEGVREQLRKGERIDLTEAEDKTLPAEWIMELASGSDRSYPAALRLRGVTITGSLVLRFITFPHEVILMRAQREWLRWLFNHVQSTLFGYGAKPGRLLAIAIVTIVIGTFLFSADDALIKKEASREKPGAADPFIVSAKLFVPTPDLAPFQKFEPATKWAH
ncbi:MAG TPA: hypothetical protein VGQ21_10400, partial [Thermoanaerobaculia bacterium]|nr:hypothetical protein [Thermoanaerobaculia bacterium]